MNWSLIRLIPRVDTRARFVAQTRHNGSLLDLGSSDGETLRHFAELRPDLRFFATDLDDQSKHYPIGCEFFKADLERDRLPWADQSMDAITCMHLVEHLRTFDSLLSETWRLLAPGGRAYFETPHPKSLVLSSAPGAATGTFPYNFFDYPGHTKIVPTGLLASYAREKGFEILDSGISRNWIFAALYPVIFFLPNSRQKFTSHLHWMGWSAFLTVRRSK